MAAHRRVMSLNDIPDNLIFIILSFINDPVSLCRIESTSKLLQSLAKRECLWEGLHRHRWTFQSPLLTKADYERRHKLDAAVVHYLECLRNKRPASMQILRLFMQTGREAIDCCWMVHQRTQDEDYQDLIVSGVFLLQRVSLFQDAVQLRRNHEENQDDLRLEGYAILSSLLCSDTAYPNFEQVRADIGRRLDDLAARIRRQFPVSSSSASSASSNAAAAAAEDLSDLEKVRIINHVLFDEEGFSGNVEHYYQFQNSLLDACLVSKQAIPMTLAILYKLVARRVGLAVDVIGLPGHIVVGVPSVNNNCFIDVFQQGRILDLPAITNIFNSYGFRFRTELLEPLCPEDILKRVCNNLASCIVGISGQQDYISSQRILLVGLLKRLLYNPSAQLVETCHSGLGRMWLYENDFQNVALAACEST